LRARETATRKPRPAGQSGDVILAVGGKTVDNPRDVRKALSDAKSQGKHDVLLRVKTADAMKLVALRMC
jgi:serine protease Do